MAEPDSGIPQREATMWRRIRPSADAAHPDAIASTLSIPFWIVITSIVIFIPLALIVAFFVSRQIVLVERGAIVVTEMSFWRYRLGEQLLGKRLGEADIRLDGKVLLIDELKLHLEPGWLPSAETIIALNDAAKP